MNYYKIITNGPENIILQLYKMIMNKFDSRNIHINLAGDPTVYFVL